jgi:phytanoyl-CoA hydroxylase
VGEAQKVAQFYHPVLQMDGNEIKLDVSERGGPCGVWVEQNGKPAVEIKN